MIYNLADICFNNIKIDKPNNIKENEYLFPIIYDDREELKFMSNNIYSIEIEENICKLHIKELKELSFFNNLQRHLVEIMYNEHDNWF